MSTAGYDIPPHSQFESRRTSANMTASYERISNTPHRPRTPSPGPSRRGYDSYVPHRPENIPYRNVYRPNNYRPDPSSYHPRSPSPDLRSPESTSYRGSSWRPPDRRPLPLSPTSRRFEHPDSWRYGHADRSSRDYSSQSDRNFRGRSSMDLSPERSPRYERLSSGVPDRYGPPYFKREPWPAERRTVADTYRPHYEDELPPQIRRDYPLSPTNGHIRRESESSLASRPTEPDFARVPMKQSSSGGVLASPAPVNWMLSDSPFTLPLTRDALTAITDVLKGGVPPLSPSRSSIASTHLSDRESPGVASIPQRLPEHLAGLPAKPQAAIEALAKENLRADATYGVKPVPNSVISQTPMHAIELENVLEPSLSALKELAKDTSQNGIPASQANAQAAIEDEPLTIMSAPDDVNGQTDVDGRLRMPHSESRVSRRPTPVHESLRSPVLRDVSTPNSAAVESEHSKPGRTPSIQDVDMSALEIPATTHSPTGSPDPSKETDTDQVDLLAHSTLPKLEEIPMLSSARTMREVLRIAVMTRLLRDHQSYEARVNPVLMANRAIAPPPEVHPTSTPGSLIDDMCSGLAHDSRFEAASKTRPLLVKYLADRQSLIVEKKARLHEEYIILQDRWIAHCNAISEHHRTLASEQETQPPVRTTRRSMAITDAVRSDFEMEQILASLGNDDATDPNHLSIRNLARVPEMISAVNGKVDIVFDDMNYLVDDPAEYYAPDTGISDWTDEEKKIFMEKFGAHPKQFGVIAEFLPNKTASQCVAYYYLHKKMFIDFRRVISQYAPNKRRRRGMGRKKGNGLLADIAMHDLEVHRGSGSASPSTSAPAARASRGRKSLSAISAVKPQPPSRRNFIRLEETPTSTPTPEPEVKSRKRRAPSGTSTPVPFIPFNPSPMPLLASTPLKLSTPSVSELHFIPSQPPPLLEPPASVEEEDTLEPAARSKRPRRTRKIKSAVIVVDEPASPPLQTVLLPANEMTESPPHGAGRKERGVPSIVQWSDDDKKRFLSLFAQYGTDFKQIAALMPPKTIGQVTSYYNAHQVSLIELASRGPNAPLPPDNHEPHWSTFPASETNRKVSSPPSSSPATLMTTIKPSPMSAPGGYDSSRNVYPAPSRSSYNNASADIPSASWSPHPSVHSMSPNGSATRHKFAPAAPESFRTTNPFNPPRRSGMVQNMLSSESSQGYAGSTGKYPEEHSHRLPSRQSLPNPYEASPPSLSHRTPQDYRHPRPRMASSHSSPSHAAGGAAIIHSPVMLSPHLPQHQSPPPYNSYTPPNLPHGNTSPPNVDSRERAAHYHQQGHSHYQGSSRQRSGSSTGWIQPSSPHPQERRFHQPGNVSYDDRRSASFPRESDHREPYPDFPPRPGSNDNQSYPGHGWHPSSKSASHSNPPRNPWRPGW